VTAEWLPSNEGVALVVVDMQEGFLQETPWHVPDMGRLLPLIERLATAYAPRVVFTRFVYQNPRLWPSDGWQAYYDRWSFWREQAALEEIVAGLRGYAEVAIDKPTYSCVTPAFLKAIAAMDARRLLFVGVETDVCVLASVFAAVDAGYRCAVIGDACTSSVPETHDAAIEIFKRMPDQIEVLRSDNLVRKTEEIHGAT